MATKKKVAKQAERFVLVTSGVFGGYAKDVSGETIKLRDARLCVYWSRDMKGFMGLASQGPSASCRIGPPADIELRNITAVVECDAEAVKKWEDAPWQS